MAELPEFCDPIDIPDAINTEGIIVYPNKCFLNSYGLASANPGMTIIEGTCLGINNEGGGHFFAHVWNKFGENYYDVTREKILSRFPEIVKIVYSPLCEYNPGAFSGSDVFEFRKETIDEVAALNGEIEK